jgi:predicted transcriptional regulator
MTRSAVNITQRTGKTAFILRTIFDFIADNPKLLREVQQHCIDQGKVVDADIRLEYVKSLTREMETRGLMTKTRAGRNFVLSLTTQGQEFVSDYQQSGNRWGVDISDKPFLNEEELDESNKFFNQLFNQPVRFKQSTRDEKPMQHRAFWSVYKSGDVDFLSIPASARVARSKSDPNRYIIQVTEQSERGE